MRRYIIPLALTALVLSGCGSNDTAPAESPSSASSSPSASPTATASATPSPSPTADASATGEPSAQPTESATAAPVEEPTAGSEESGSAIGGPPAENDGQTTSMAEFLANGDCASDGFPAGPPTNEVAVEIVEYCQGQEDTTEANGHQRPEADENGYVGPSREFYDYKGYVEPGFEYQVGSECFEPSLGRCKSSGEIQSEHMAEQNGGTP